LLEVAVILDPGTQEELMTAGEVAALLHVDPKTVTGWAMAGRLVAVRTPEGDCRYLRSEVLPVKSGLRRDHDLDRDAAQDPAQEPSGDNSQDKIVVPSPRDGHTTDPVVGGAVEVDSEHRAAAAAVNSQHRSQRSVTRTPLGPSAVHGGAVPDLVCGIQPILAARRSARPEIRRWRNALTCRDERACAPGWV
jgi:hypothetical protein